MKKTSYEISYAVITSIGERNTNEDAYGILELPDKKYFLVCDGRGGHGDGLRHFSGSARLLRDKGGAGISGLSGVLQRHAG